MATTPIALGLLALLAGASFGSNWANIVITGEKAVCAGYAVPLVAEVPPGLAGGTYYWAKATGPSAGSLTFGAGSASPPPSGEAKDVEATMPGTYTVEVSYLIAGAMPSEESDPVTFVAVELLQMEIDAETAADEVALKKTGSDWSDDTYASDGDTDIGGSNPIWEDADLDDSPEVEDPVCVVAGGSLKIAGGGKTKINVDGLDSSTLAAEIKVVLTASGDSGFADDFELGPVAITLADGDVAVPAMSASSAGVGDRINNFTYDMAWLIKIDGIWYEFEEVGQTVFVTGAAPASGVGASTATRLDILTAAAAGESPASVGNVIKKLHQNIFQPQTTGTLGPPSPLWEALDPGNNVNCVDYVDLFHDEAIPMLLGGTYGAKRFLWCRQDGSVYESTGPDPSNLDTRACTGTSPVTHGTETLRLVSSSGGSPDYGFPNKYQAALLYSSEYFPPSFAEQASKEDVLDTVFDYVAWYFLYGGTPYHCTSPGPAGYNWPAMTTLP